MKMRFFSSLIPPLCALSLLTAAPQQDIEPFEDKPVARIEVSFENQAPGEEDTSGAVLGQLQTKAGENFSQEAFDSDLKKLSEEYDWVNPTIRVKEGKVYVDLTIKKKPIVTKFEVSGTKYSTKKILSEAELTVGMRYDRENFYQAINRIREFLIKKGFFKSEITYQIESSPNSSDITILIDINEGPSGRINKIMFEGFSTEEEKAVLGLIRSKKFNILTSWVTGSGTIKEDDIEPDVQSIVHYLQNEGYVDAHVTMAIEELPKNKLALVIKLSRGEKYHLHNITFSGFTLQNEETLKKASHLQPGDVFSADKLQEAKDSVRDIYTQDGYIHTHVDYTLTLVSDKPEYDVHFTVEESNQYRVGLVMVTGNYSTDNNVIYNNIDFEPGATYDSRKIKSTQQRLQSTGYFKSVNVYPVQGDEETFGNAEYCDVMVEVNEAQTGSASLFMGFSSTDNVFGGIDFTENNFSLSGLRNVWTQGPSAFRGGGQYLQIKGTIGVRENGANVSWMNPYIFDTLWRFGVDGEFSQSSILSRHYNIRTAGGAISASYPVSPYFSSGFRFRVRDSIIGISSGSPPDAKEQKHNSGLVTGLALTLAYDTTDNTFKPHRGIRSSFEAEMAGLVRRHTEFNDFPFARIAYLNSFYYPVWRKGTFKVRSDFKFITPFLGGKGNELPLSERFFLGGEGTVRGYSPGKIGPTYGDNEPTGGISSILLSAEYLQNIVKPLDIFVFFDAGSISLSKWSVNKINMSYGTGLRFDVGRQLPFVVGVGFPINARSGQKQRLFFSMAGQF